MYASVILLKMEDANYDELHQAALNATDIFKGQKGFVSSVYYSDKEKGEYGMTTVWETKEDLEAFGNSRPESQEMIKKYGVRNIYYVNNYITKD